MSMRVTDEMALPYRQGQLRPSIALHLISFTVGMAMKAGRIFASAKPGLYGSPYPLNSKLESRVKRRFSQGFAIIELNTFVNSGDHSSLAWNILSETINWKLVLIL